MIRGGAPPGRERTWTPKKLISLEPTGRQSPASTSEWPEPVAKTPTGLVPGGRRGTARQASPLTRKRIFALFDAEKINYAKTDRGVYSPFGRRVALGVGP